MAVSALEKIAGVKREEFVLELFKAKSNVVGLSLETITTTDYKSFTVHGVNFGFGVIETTNPDEILVQTQELIQVLRKVKQQEKVKFMFFSVVDVVKMESKLILVGSEEEHIVKEAFGGKLIDKGVYDVGNLVSRKKDFIPPLSKYFRD